MDTWDALNDAKPRLLATFADLGVERVEYNVGFVDPCRVSVWLGTASDAQKEELTAREGLWETVAEVLNAAGIESTDAVCDAVVVQSQETVERDYEGSWFYALR